MIEHLAEQEEGAPDLFADDDDREHDPRRKRWSDRRAGPGNAFERSAGPIPPLQSMPFHSVEGV